jgi:folate-binding protein YgfZ
MGATAVPGSIERGYHALHNGAVVVDRSDRLRMRFSGAKAAEALTGLVTNDVASLTPGRGQYAAALTNKGKVIADVRIFAVTDGYLVDVAPAAAPGFAAMIRKFVNPRLAKYEDISANMGDLGVFGSSSAELIRSELPDAKLSGDMSNYSHSSVNAGEATLIVAHVSDFGVDGYDILGPPDVLRDLRSKFVTAGAVEDAEEALNIARIESGRPAWGIDMDDTLLAQEVDMDRLDAISYTKGCYTGQETVARVHYRGHVNRVLRGLRIQDGGVPPAGSTLLDESGKEVGVVKSGAVSPRNGAIALAVVRREVEPGTRVTATWAASASGATVVELPF